MAPTTRTSRLTRPARPRLPPPSSAVSATLAKPTKPTTPTTSPPSSSKHWLAVLRGKGIPFPQYFLGASVSRSRDFSPPFRRLGASLHRCKRLLHRNRILRGFATVAIDKREERCKTLRN